MKRYIVFAGDEYYPAGGWKDYRAAFDTLQEATAFLRGWMANDPSCKWAHVADLENLQYQELPDDA